MNFKSEYSLEMWSIQLVKLLIFKYREHENLYNTRDPCYFDQGKRTNSMIKICTELQELNKNVTVDDIQEKIHTLRVQFIEELQMEANSERNGSNDIYEPKLWCFEQLQFLRPHCNIDFNLNNCETVDNNLETEKCEDLSDSNSASESDSSNPCLTDLTEVSESDDLESSEPNPGSIVLNK